MQLKVFNKFGKGHFFVKVRSTNEIELIANEGFKFEYMQSRMDMFKFSTYAQVWFIDKSVTKKSNCVPVILGTIISAKHTDKNYYKITHGSKMSTIEEKDLFGTLEELDKSVQV